MSAWLFPYPVREGRFEGLDGFNIEVAPERLNRFAFHNRVDERVAYFDYQTVLDGTYPGRHGAGRAAVYKGHYVKGIGLTPANANWNDPAERYHGTGHMSPGSAAREYLISRELEARGLGGTIVPCVGVLAAELTAKEKKFVAQGTTSAKSDLSAADANLMALSVKRADFARMSNIVWALDHFAVEAARIGQLFLDFEMYLRAPGERENLEGSGNSIGQAMEAAFDRGMSHFDKWREAGLFWIYAQNNFTLDGRWVDLETPMLVGQPYLGTMSRAGKPDQFLGFEEFWFVWYWRVFLKWLDAKLSYLLQPGMFAERAIVSYLKDLRGSLRKRFHGKHRIFDDGWLMQRTRSKSKQQRALMEWRWRVVFRADPSPVPDLGWIKEEAEVAGPFATETVLKRPRGFAGLEAKTCSYADAVRQADAEGDLRGWLKRLS